MLVIDSVIAAVCLFILASVMPIKGRTHAANPNTRLITFNHS